MGFRDSPCFLSVGGIHGWWLVVAGWLGRFPDPDVTSVPQKVKRRPVDINNTVETDLTNRPSEHIPK